MTFTHFSSSFGKNARGLTLIELLIVITIIGILLSAAFTGFQQVQKAAHAATSTSNLRNIAVATLTFAAENGGKLPSPQYPGSVEVPGGTEVDDFYPAHWNVGGTGLWLDGVIFGAIYLKDVENGGTGSYDFDEQGSHLKGTIFESKRSRAVNPEELDFHQHSYAMNSNLQYDRIYDEDGFSVEDPYLTEKTLSNFVHAPNAMLFIECSSTNIVNSGDIEAIRETGRERWGKTQKVITAFADGHAERIRGADIPEGDPESGEREVSRFWRGVDE